MGALVLVRRCLARPYRAAFVGGGFLPRALPWAGLARTVGAQNNLRPLRSVADASSVRVPQRKMHRPRPLPSLPSNSCPLRACLDGTGPPHYVRASRDPYVVRRPKSTEASSVGAQKSPRPLCDLRVLLFKMYGNVLRSVRLTNNHPPHTGRFFAPFESSARLDSLLSPINSLAARRPLQLLLHPF